jgi:hypothetical protein
VTFLFTDVEGSTRRWEADADGMRAALAAHDEVLGQAIEAHGGWVFKHTGDGVCAAFASPRSAVDAAVAAQQALELSVRMGIATGEAELRDGDYFGAVLNRAARVMAAGRSAVLVTVAGIGLTFGMWWTYHSVPAVTGWVVTLRGPAAVCLPDIRDALFSGFLGLLHAHPHLFFDAGWIHLIVRARGRGGTGNGGLVHRPNQVTGRLHL